jgi:hypothetical protein
MKKLSRWFCILPFILALSACQVQSSYSNKSGTLFIHQQICDLGDFKKGFFSHQNDLLSHGFQAYSFHRDSRDPKGYILAFQCADLNQAARFIQKSNFYISCVGAGLGLPEIWSGESVKEHIYRNQTPMTGDIVVVRCEMKDYGVWKKYWDSQNQPGDSLYYSAGHPEVVILAHEVPDITQAQAFLDSQLTPSAMEAAGVIRLDYWIGTNLEEGTFNQSL